VRGIRRDDAAAGLAADRKSYQPGGRSGAWSGARPRRALFEQPQIHGLTAEPDIVERQRSQTHLGHLHGASLAQAFHHRAIRAVARTRR
jgi:hypothetical protein